MISTEIYHFHRINCLGGGNMFRIFRNWSRLGENRSGKIKPLKAFLSLLVALLLSLLPAQVDAASKLPAPGCRSASSQTIDFSTVGEGTFQPKSFKRQGLVLTE